VPSSQSAAHYVNDEQASVRKQIKIKYAHLVLSTCVSYAAAFYIGSRETGKYNVQGLDLAATTDFVIENVVARENASDGVNIVSSGDNL